MPRSIDRRDFLNGMALAIGSSLLPRTAWGSSADASSHYYPPTLTGLRGSYDAAYTFGHALREPDFWEKAGAPVDTGETYDLVVVGGGISGLSAAHYFRREAGSSARVLVLDNHDDFGGHAKRNEYHVGGRMILGYGGTFSIDSPAPYSTVAKGLITQLGIDVSRWEKVVDFNLYASRGLKSGVFFDKETFGADKVLPFSNRVAVGEGETTAQRDAAAAAWTTFLAEAPLPMAARRDIQRLYSDTTDHLPGLTSDQKKARLARMSYASFLTGPAKAHPDVVKFFQSRPHSLYGFGIDAVPAQDAWGLGFPGFGGMGLDPSFGPGMNHDAKLYPDGGGAYFFHFPDGNASVARLLVRSLIPGAIPGSTADDIVLARCDYSRLDDASSPARIRLDSTALRVVHAGEPGSAKEVEIVYGRGSKLYKVRARRCILACWSAMIPYLCDSLPESQKADLAFAIKVPIIYTNVLISNWQPFVKAGLSAVHCPGAYWSAVNLDLPVSLGGYRCSQSPDEPIVLHLVRTPCSPGLPARDQHRAGRAELLTTPFETFEKSIRDQLARIVGPSGFDADKDIRAITVNRWAHGYAYQYNSLFDDFWLEGKETPCERARKPFGRIAIANADTRAYSYTDAAIDSAYRAVGEVLKQ